MPSEAKKYHAYARECLHQAEKADIPERREKLFELSRVWLEAALPEGGRGKPSPDWVAGSIGPKADERIKTLGPCDV